jgi:hypothetical protein
MLPVIRSLIAAAEKMRQMLMGDWPTGDRMAIVTTLYPPLV